MKRRVCIWLPVVVIFSSSPWLYGQEPKTTQPAHLTSPDPVALARDFIDHLNKQEFAAAAKNLDDNLKSELTADKLQANWKVLTDRFGPFRKQGADRKEKSDPYIEILLECEFTKALFDAELLFDGESKIAGITFTPKYRSPIYAQPDLYIEQDVVVGNSPWELPGILTLPLGEGPFPAVVLVPGVGAHDRDLQVGPNKPFCDLARGLACRRIAVLRYDKRIKAHADKIAVISAFSREAYTVWEDIIEDALSAEYMMRNTPLINKEKVFILGHSLGGMIIPRLAKQAPHVAGFIIMTAAARPLEDVILERMSYIMSLESSPPEDLKKEFENLKKQVARAKDPHLTTTAPAQDLPFELPASYWLDLRGYNPTAEAKPLKKPVLIMQGGRDYVANEKDFQVWKRSLSSRPNVSFKFYKQLNNLFMEGKGKIAPAEYNQPGNVAEQVILDIADWIKKQ